MSGASPRSIALYVPSLQAGGAERAAAVLASGFHAAGLSTTLLVDQDGEANRAFLHAGVEQVRLGGGHAASVLRLARWLSRARPDVALAVDAAASAKLAAAGLLARVPTRLYLSYHGYFPIVRGLLGRSAYHAAPVLARHAERIVCVSEGLKRHLIRDWQVPATCVVAIPNPVPVELARPAADAAALRKRPPTIVAVGRLVPEKRFADLIGALEHCPDDTRLVILGEGPERSALEGAASRFGARVALPGYAEPWMAYAEARVFALASTSESFGNVVVEALASGLPVVATDCGGPSEILSDPRFGRLVPVGDRIALGAELRAALADPGDPVPRVARAAEYGTAQVVDAYLKLFAGRA